MEGEKNIPAWITLLEKAHSCIVRAWGTNKWVKRAHFWHHYLVRITSITNVSCVSDDPAWYQGACMERQHSARYSMLALLRVNTNTKKQFSLLYEIPQFLPIFVAGVSMQANYCWYHSNNCRVHDTIRRNMQSSIKGTYDIWIWSPAEMTPFLRLWLKRASQFHVSFTHSLDRLWSPILMPVFSMCMCVCRERERVRERERERDRKKERVCERERARGREGGENH